MSGGSTKEVDLFLSDDACQHVFVNVDFARLRDIGVTVEIDKEYIYVVNANGLRMLTKLPAKYPRQRSKPQRRIPIERPPGMRLNRLAQFVFPRRIYETVLRPCIAETQEEYFEALQAGDLGKAKWIRRRGVFLFWATVLGQIPQSIIRMVWRPRT
jgi:hypothetical protein